MQLRDDGTLRLSPSDLSNHLACAHLTTLSLAAARGEIVKPKLESPHRELIFRKGNEHEDAYLARLERERKTIVSLPTPDDADFDPNEAAQLTEQVIRAGTADVIYQPCLTDGAWFGFADFLERLPDGGYEPVDTKLARSAKPSHVLQLLFYAEQVERIQGSTVEHVHVENGLGDRETFRVAEFDAYYRRIRERLLAAVADEPETYGWPVSHCGICDFRLMCRARRVGDDHLSLVAGVRRAQAETLIDGGVTTLEQLGDLPTLVGDGLLPAGTDAKPYERVRLQAAIQLRGRREERYLYELLPDEEDRGFRLLPEPDAGDVWFDMEGHPFYETSRGLEYLFGYCYRDDDGAVRYAAVWGRDRDGEREAFERFVDWIVERRREHPRLHVYHYAAYERSALTRLMGEHGTREREVDDFLRQEVLVDLYRIVRQSLRASTESYSIKEIEKLYGFERTAEVSGGDESVVRFEEWVETGDDSLLEEVERYNEEDCRSTFELHEWLLSIRPPETAWRLPPDERPKNEEAEQLDAEREALKERLLVGADESSPRRLLANLVDYHQREQRPEWWAWFRWPQLDDEELVRDRTAIGGLVWDGRPPEVEGRSHAYRMTFPPQEHKIEKQARGPDDDRGFFRVRVDDDEGVVTVLRATEREEDPLPRGLTPGQPIPIKVLREALLRFVGAYADGDRARYPALTALLERQPPEVDLAAADPVDAALSLGPSYLFVQGPPGSGKTWQGARMAIALMRAGKRVGVTSLSHKAINNMLRAVQHEADRQGFDFSGVKKASEDDPEEAYTARCFVSSGDADICADPSFQLVAGTAWALTRETVDLHVVERPIDVLFVDEAGQLSLADVLAAGTSARSLILLGDPNQLPQVSQGSHPEDSGRSVLQHLLGDDVTIPPDRGIFLAETWRLRPELCDFTSDAYYGGRLRPAPITATRSLAAGDGPEWVSVRHLHRGQSSVEEADAVAALVARLVGTPFLHEGSIRPLREGDILVVAPYNAQVRTLRSRLPATVPVGTVDKFQGQEAPVVVVSMASSTPDDAPRGIGFAFDRNRFNVATSRAQCTAVLVCTPALLDVDCRTVEQMRLVAAVCRFVELAT